MVLNDLLLALALVFESSEVGCPEPSWFPMPRASRANSFICLLTSRILSSVSVRFVCGELCASVVEAKISAFCSAAGEVVGSNSSARRRADVENDLDPLALGVEELDEPEGLDLISSFRISGAFSWLSLSRFNICNLKY